MEQDKILLTIGIPVYNGEEFIEDTIKSIYVSNNLKNNIEILVSDNCSTDKTEQIVKRFPQVKYLKNTENIGYDRNIQNIFTNAQGHYVWTIAADDIITNLQAIDIIVNLINNQHDVALIHVGGNNDLPFLYNINNSEKFFIDSKFQSGAVSSNIINRKTWLISDPASFFDTGWIHFGVIINIANHYKTIVTRENLVIENPCAIYKAKQWNVKGSSLVIMLNLIKIFTNMDKLNYSKKIQKMSKMLIKRNYPQEIIKAKASGLKINLNLLFDFIKCYKFFFSFWIIDFPFLLSPKIFCKIIYRQRNVFK